MRHVDPLAKVVAAFHKGGVRFIVMGEFEVEVEVVWERRRTFVVDDVEIPVARLADIVTSKANAGREKDRLFLATHAEALRNLIRGDDEPHG